MIEWLQTGFWLVIELSESVSESESETELLYEWRFTANQFVLATSPLRLTTSSFIFQMKICRYSPYVTSSLIRGWVCRLQLLLVLASAVIPGSESRWTHDHILLSQIGDSPNLEGQVPVFISHRPSYTPGHLVPFSSSPITLLHTDLSNYRTNCPAYNISARPSQKVATLLQFTGRCLVMAVISLPCNGSTCLVLAAGPSTQWLRRLYWRAQLLTVKEEGKRRLVS
jgi:hypothetical protein